MKVNQIINDSLISLGVIDPTENPAKNDTEFGLRVLNRIFDTMNAQNLTIPYSKYVEYDNVEWHSTAIEIGIGKTIDAQQPQSIEEALFRKDDTDYPLRSMTQTEYNRISVKNVVDIPTKYYYQRTDRDTTVIYFNTIPPYGYKLICKIKDKYPKDLKVTDDIFFGDGIETYIVSRLAIELSPSYHIEPPAALVLLYANAENAIKARNYQAKTLKIDNTLKNRRCTSRYNLARM